MRRKTILLTGASRGIGFATAQLLVEEGHIVYATSRDPSRALELTNLAKKHPNLKLRKLDITKNKDISRVIKEIVASEGGIDVLIPNAAYVLFGPIETVSLRQAREQFEVGFFGPLNLMQQTLPYMRKAKKGQIICLGSSSGVESSPMYGIYSASKFALESMMFALAANVSPWGIQVSLIELTATATDLCAKSLKKGGNLKEKMYLNYLNNSYTFLKNIILNGGNPCEIANKILFVINSEVKRPRLRYMATKRAEKIFKECLKDPFGLKLADVIKQEKEWFKNG